jgi:hypothetical protein
MKTLSIVLVSALSLAGSVILLDSCGANHAGTLQSITLSPSTVPAGDTRTIQFVATGYINPSFVQTPLVVEAPLEEGWSYTGPQGEKLSLTRNGLATCGSATGTFVVSAWALRIDTDGPVCNVIGPGGAPCSSIAGTAQFTCP